MRRFCAKNNPSFQGGYLAILKIKILSWDDHQCGKRKDVHNPSWFAFKHSFFLHPKILALSDAEKLTWIYLLCEKSQRRKDDYVTVNTELFHRVTGRDSESFHRDAKKLKQLQMIEMRTSRGRSADVPLDKKREEEKREEEKREEERRREESATSGEAPVIAIPEISDSLTLELLEKVKLEIQESWLKLYPEPGWVKGEIQQAAVWCKANSARKPKSDYGRFLTAWLARGWEKHRKTLPSNHIPKKSDYSYLEERP
jgi:hypothetical protein